MSDCFKEWLTWNLLLKPIMLYFILYNEIEKLYVFFFFMVNVAPANRWMLPHWKTVMEFQLK